ncbi:MAG: class I SAM-dependent methyltransferase [Pirellulales bacterium]|nr:class I SAM-dependent methyltransferase [Pirellulales bacterium]
METLSALPAPPSEYLADFDAHQRRTVDEFHRVYYNARYRGLTWGNTHWLGVPTLKCPLDLWLYQEIVHELRPDYIVETGTAHGGSALYLASICDLVQHGNVLTIDIRAAANWPRHPRITYLIGSSTSPEMERHVTEHIGQGKRVLVILDSDHRREHVLREMEIYSRLVHVGGYLIVEDTIVTGDPIAKESQPGAREAVFEFLGRRDDFAIDRKMEKLLVSFNRHGYLKRLR